MPKGYKIWPNQVKHCFCCLNANWFISSPEDEDSIEDMVVRCRYFPNEDKLVDIGADCQHFKNTFNVLKMFHPDMVSF